MTSCLGELSAGNLYHCVTVGQWFFYDWLKISSAQDISSALNRQSREFKIHNYTAWLAPKRNKWLNSLWRSLGPHLGMNSEIVLSKHLKEGLWRRETDYFES